MYHYDGFQHGSYESYDEKRQLGPILGGLFGSPGQGRPPFGPPGRPPTGPPSFGPPGQGGSDGPPSGPPPSFTPTQNQVSTFAVDPGGIRRCLYRFTYVWLSNRQQFWFYPTFVGRNSVAGYRWMGFFWAYFGTDLRRIDSFQCF